MQCFCNNSSRTMLAHHNWVIFYLALVMVCFHQMEGTRLEVYTREWISRAKVWKRVKETVIKVFKRGFQNIFNRLNGKR